METYQAMNEQICEMLRTCGHLTEDYAAARIEELEQQLREAQEAAQAQGETAQHDWLSPAEAEGLRQQLAASIEVANIYAPYRESSTKYARAARIARQQLHAECRIAEKAEALLADAMDELQAERQEHQGDAHTIHALRRELRETKADLATMDADRQDDRLGNPHFGTSPRYLVEVQRDRLKDQLKETRKALADARQTILLDCMDREGCD